MRGWQSYPHYQQQVCLQGGRNKGSSLDVNKDFKMGNKLVTFKVIDSQGSKRFSKRNLFFVVEKTDFSTQN